MTTGVCPPAQGHREAPSAHSMLAPGRSPPIPMAPPGTDQVYQLLIADLALVVALRQGHQHVQLGGVQGQLMAVHEAGEGLHPDEAGVFGVELRGTAQGITGMLGLHLPSWPGGDRLVPLTLASGLAVPCPVP